MTSITIFTRENCAPCHRAKAMLHNRGLSFREVDVNSGDAARDEFLKRTEGAKTVPQILVGDDLIGGSDKLEAIIDSLEFQQMIGGQ